MSASCMSRRGMKRSHERLSFGDENGDRCRFLRTERGGVDGAAFIADALLCDVLGTALDFDRGRANDESISNQPASQPAVHSVNEESTDPLVAAKGPQNSFHARQPGRRSA